MFVADYLHFAEQIYRLLHLLQFRFVQKQLSNQIFADFAIPLRVDFIQMLVSILTLKTRILQAPIQHVTQHDWIVDVDAFIRATLRSECDYRFIQQHEFIKNGRGIGDENVGGIQV